jgi:hypothetical protein
LEFLFLFNVLALLPGDALAGMQFSNDKRSHVNRQAAW